MLLAFETFTLLHQGSSFLGRHSVDVHGIGVSLRGVLSQGVVVGAKVSAISKSFLEFGLYSEVCVILHGSISPVTDGGGNVVRQGYFP